MDTSLDRFYGKAFSLKLNLPEAFYALTAESVLNALGYMRKLKIMHRDIKPSNILLNAQGQIKVCDFGISGFTNSDSLCKTFKGCQRYMSVGVSLQLLSLKLKFMDIFFFYSA